MPQDEKGHNLDFIQPTNGQAQSAVDSQKQQHAFIEQLKEPSPIGKHSNGLVIAIIATVVVLVEFVISLAITTNRSSNIKTLDRRISDAKAQLATEPLASLDTQITYLSNGLKTYEKSVSDDRNFAYLWKDLKQKTVDNTRLRNLSVSNKNVVTITGEARDYSDIAKLIVSYRGSDSLRNVALLSTVSREKLKEFSLTANYVAPVITPVSPTNSILPTQSAQGTTGAQL